MLFDYVLGAPQSWKVWAEVQWAEVQKPDDMLQFSILLLFQSYQQLLVILPRQHRS